MPVRLILILVSLATAGWFLQREQQTGRFQKADEMYVDFLMAHTRDQFQKKSPTDEVVLVEMREEQQGEYESWPPPPVDWLTLLKDLQTYQPELLVIATPLNWGTPPPEFADAVADALLPFQSVVLGVEAELTTENATTPPPAYSLLGELDARLPRFSEVNGDASSVPTLSALLRTPDPLILGSSELGLLCLEKKGGSWSLPYAVKAGDRLVPTLLAQAVSRHSRSPYLGGHRLRLGAGAGAFLQNGFYVPLESEGSLRVANLPPAPVVNALDLMAGSLADATSERDKQLLSKARILVVGITAPAKSGQPPTFPALYASALSHLLTLPHFTVLSQPGQWAVWATVALMAMWQVVRVPRSRAIWTGLTLIGLVLVVGFIAFQGSRIWCPPIIPLSFLAIGTLLTRLIGKKRVIVSSASSVAMPEQPATEPAATKEKKAEVASAPPEKKSEN